MGVLSDTLKQGIMSVDAGLVRCRERFKALHERSQYINMLSNIKKLKSLYEFNK
jgi:hypothetical protein